MLVNYIEAYYFQSTENQKRKRVRGNIGWGICKHSLYCLYSSFKVWSYFKIEIKRKKFSQLVSLLPLDQWFSEFFFFFSFVTALPSTSQEPSKEIIFPNCRPFEFWALQIDCACLCTTWMSLLYIKKEYVFLLSTHKNHFFVLFKNAYSSQKYWRSPLTFHNYLHLTHNCQVLLCIQIWKQCTRVCVRVHVCVCVCLFYQVH